MLKNWLIISTIVCLTLLAVFFRDTPPQNLLQEMGLPTKADARHPSSILNNASSKRFDALTGRMVSTVSAPEIRYYQVSQNRQSPDDYAVATQPRLSFHPVDAEPWFASADEAIINPTSDRFELRSQVLVRRTLANGQPTEMRTELMIIDTNQEYAETDKAVKITSPGSTLQAVGMRAQLKQNTVTLLSNVRGTHEP